MQRSDMPSFSVVVETENLGMAGLEDLEACLDSLSAQTLSIEQAEEVLLIAGAHVSADVEERIRKRYPWVTVHRTNQSLDYTQAKYLGAELASGEVVVFADSDARYQSTWLENLLNCFVTELDTDIAAGETMCEIRSAYTMSLNLTWMFVVLPHMVRPMPTNGFQLNNFAARRNVVLQVIPADLPFFRGKRVTNWVDRVLATGRGAYRVPGAVAFHLPPETLADWWYRITVNGRDFVASADFTIASDGGLIENASIRARFAYLRMLLPSRIKRAIANGRTLLAKDRRNLPYLILSLPICAINIFTTMLGGAIAVFNRDYFYRKIKSREAGHVV